MLNYRTMRMLEKVAAGDPNAEYMTQQGRRSQQIEAGSLPVTAEPPGAAAFEARQMAARAAAAKQKVKPVAPVKPVKPAAAK